jgi:hypothetical protein
MLVKIELAMLMGNKYITYIGGRGYHSADKCNGACE